MQQGLDCRGDAPTGHRAGRRAGFRSGQEAGIMIDNCHLLITIWQLPRRCETLEESCHACLPEGLRGPRTNTAGERRSLKGKANTCSFTHLTNWRFAPLPPPGSGLFTCPEKQHGRW